MTLPDDGAGVADSLRAVVALFAPFAVIGISVTKKTLLILFGSMLIFSLISSAIIFKREKTIQLAQIGKNSLLYKTQRDAEEEHSAISAATVSNNDKVVIRAC